MKKEDIDLYLNNVNNAQTDAERLALTKDFLRQLNDSVIVIESDRYLTTYPVDKDIINYMVESGALFTFHEIGAGKIVDLSRVVGYLIDEADTPNKDGEREKIDEQLDKLLQDPEMLPENSTQEQIELYDALIVRKVYCAIHEEKPIDDVTIDATKRLFDSLPDSKTHRSTLLYKRQILRSMVEREDIRDLIPRLPAEEYRDMIAHPAKSGKGMTRTDYDNMINEFLSFYGESGEISAEEKHDLFKNITSRYRVGTLMDSNTYTKYFMGTYTDEKFMTLYGSQDVLIRDVLARIYEKSGNDVRTTEAEKEIFDMFFLPKEHDMSVEDPEFYAKMKSKDENYDPKFTYNGIFKEMLSELFLHSSDNWVDVARYMVRLKKMFAAKDRPTDEFLASVYDYAISLDVFDELKRNLQADALKEYDPDDKFNREEIYAAFGWEYTEEQRRIDEENEKWKKENGFDPNRTRSGLRRIDCADIALELMLEADFGRALVEFRNQDNITNFRTYGKDLYNSRAVRKLTELYVDDTKRDQRKFSAEPIIRKFIDKVSSSPDFNIFNEQEISEVLQLGYLGMSKFGAEMVGLVRSNLSKNPNYQMTNAEAQKYVSDFINSVGDNTLDVSREADFDKFLKSLTKLRINSRDGIMPEEAVDFLISQSMRSDSLINVKKDKYGKVPERAIEDLGKIDNLRRNNVNYVNRLYIVRDYIDYDTNLGLHCGDVVTIKREQIDKLPKGGLDAIDTVFHENTHMTQAYRLEGKAKDYAEYLMKKEKLIRRFSSKGEQYYDENYFQILTEIEAREVAATMTAKYVAKIAPKTQVTDIADTLKQDVASSLLDRYKVQENKYKDIAKEEAAAYKPAINKRDSDGKTRTINQIFDRRFKGTNVIKEFYASQPFAKIEYWEDGSRKTFPEQIRTIIQAQGDNLDFDFIRAIINYSGTPENADVTQTLRALSSLINTVPGEDSNRGKFISSIVKPNLPGMLGKYIDSTNNYINSTNKGTTDMVDAYTGMRTILNQINSNPNADWVQGFKEENSDGKSSLQLMESYCDMIKENFPNVDEVARKLELQREQERIRLAEEKARKELEAAQRREQLRRGTYGRKKKSFIGKLFGYNRIAKVDADIEGKRAAASYEANLRSAEQHRDEQEVINE